MPVNDGLVREQYHRANPTLTGPTASAWLHRN